MTAFRMVAAPSGKRPNKIHKGQNKPKDDYGGPQIARVDTLCQTAAYISSDGAADHHDTGLRPSDKATDPKNQNA